MNYSFNYGHKYRLCQEAEGKLIGDLLSSPLGSSLVDFAECPTHKFRERSCHKTGIRALQDFAYSYRVWITLIKLLYARLRYLNIDPDINPAE